MPKSETLSASGEVRIIDWTGKDMYPGRTFVDELDAWAFLLADQRKRHPDVTEEEFDAILGEYATKPPLTDV